MATGSQDYLVATKTQWFDRNPVHSYLSVNLNPGAAPRATTVDAQYTCPPLKKAIVESGGVTVGNNSVTAIAGRAKAQILVGSAPVATAMLVRKAADAVSCQMGGQATLGTGVAAQVTSYVEAGAAGSDVVMEGGMKVVEFDA